MNKPTRAFTPGSLAKPAAYPSPEAVKRSLAPRKPPAVIVIGASTGGPQALDVMLRGMRSYIDQVHVFVVLHTLAELAEATVHHVANAIALRVETATHGSLAEKGIIYFAPGDYHLGLSKADRRIRMSLSAAAPENFCRPSVDFLFRSAAQNFGAGVLGIVLSGMGSDGLAGSRDIVNAGGAVIVQDEASSVVWGMPGSVADEDLASAILPVNLIAPAIEASLRAKPAGGFADGL